MSERRCEFMEKTFIEDPDRLQTGEPSDSHEDRSIERGSAVEARDKPRRALCFYFITLACALLLTIVIAIHSDAVGYQRQWSDSQSAGRLLSVDGQLIYQSCMLLPPKPFLSAKDIGEGTLSLAMPPDFTVGTFDPGDKQLIALGDLQVPFTMPHKTMMFNGRYSVDFRQDKGTYWKARTQEYTLSYNFLALVLLVVMIIDGLLWFKRSARAQPSEPVAS
jgi:hypothetical protein